jgi:transcriptional regulator
VLIHPWDAGTSEQQWVDFVREQGFGQLIASGRGREIAVVVPTQFALVSAQQAVLHLARPNPVWDAIEENPTVVLSIAGDWAYIPSHWKAIAGENPAMGVPTTYYAAVQLICTARICDDVDEKAAILRTQLATTERDSGAVDPAEHGAVLNGIRGLQLSVREVKSKFKYGGNVDVAHRQAIAERLANRGGPAAAALPHIRLT